MVMLLLLLTMLRLLTLLLKFKHPLLYNMAWYHPILADRLVVRGDASLHHFARRSFLERSYSRRLSRACRIQSDLIGLPNHGVK